MNKVLVVEDDMDLQDRWRRELDGRVAIIAALSIKEAEEGFTANPDISAVVMDARVPGTTLPLVHGFRETFAGPMIATSSSPEYCDELVSAGCNYQSRKDNLPQKLLEVLGL